MKPVKMKALPHVVLTPLDYVPEEDDNECFFCGSERLWTVECIAGDFSRHFNSLDRQYTGAGESVKCCALVWKGICPTCAD